VGNGCVLIGNGWGYRPAGTRSQPRATPGRECHPAS
jgi:hypothetical protein